MAEIAIALALCANVFGSVPHFLRPTVPRTLTGLHTFFTVPPPLERLLVPTVCPRVGFQARAVVYPIPQRKRILGRSVGFYGRIFVMADILFKTSSCVATLSSTVSATLS